MQKIWFEANAFPNYHSATVQQLDKKKWNIVEGIWMQIKN